MFLYMAKKSIIEREKKRKILVNDFNDIRKLFKEKMTLSRSFEEKLFYQSKLQNLPRNSSPTRLF